MGMKTYKATGLFITAFKRLVGFRLRISGVENLPDRPTLFVANHFTRFETAMLPYALYRAVRRPVKSLATPAIFNGMLGRYLQSVGVVSVRDPRRNRMIVSDLMTGAHDWVIYPEGGLVKNKKTTDGRRLRIERADRRRPPHTGAALLALKSEICKRRYLRACADGDDERREFYEEQFDILRPEDASPHSTVIVPVTITYHAYSPGANLIHRAARRLARGLNPMLDEELQVEGSILLGRTEMNIHFGEPIDVASYIAGAASLARRIVGVFSEERTMNLGLKRQAVRLTDDAMRRVYSQQEISFEHLFCYGLSTLRQDRISVDDFRRALYLAITELQERGDLRLHPELRNGVAGAGFRDIIRPVPAR